MRDRLDSDTAFAEALSRARSLYRDGQQPLPGRLVAFKDWAQSGGPDGSEWIIVRREAAMLFASYFGHVPVESFAAAMTALDDLRATAKKVTEAYYNAGGDMTGELGEALDALDIKLGERA